MYIILVHNVYYYIHRSMVLSHRRTNAIGQLITPLIDIHMYCQWTNILMTYVRILRVYGQCQGYEILLWLKSRISTPARPKETSRGISVSPLYARLRQFGAGSSGRRPPSSLSDISVNPQHLIEWYTRVRVYLCTPRYSVRMRDHGCNIIMFVSRWVNVELW